ncbi:hypothetical protein [Mucilaginibacter sp.]|uniref:hypothetical protein n=1 Tax=Mucilaginibacter sp. TaxID=1882438 RepID=UPI002613249A|nr:hypothetical protein [Mucilaginibacter sp.]MDB4921874.1 hypothetical protein [Mucilaginibacter sp.]
MAALLLKSNRNIILITVLALLIFLGGTFILHTVPLTIKNKVANGLLADFVITFPALYYFIIVRPLKISVRRMAFVVSFCCSFAYLVLPQHQKDYILQIRKLTAVAELLFIIYAVSKFNTLRKAYKANQLLLTDPIYNLRAAMAEVIGESAAVKIIASELAVLRYGVLFWRKETLAIKTNSSFSTHKEFGYVAIWCILLTAVMVETVAFHFLLMKWSHIAANIVTVLSLYGVIFFIADLSAVIKRKVLINDEQIILRTGLRWRVCTNISNINSIEKILYDYHSADPFFKGGISKNSGNMLITFKEPVKVDKLYGASKEAGSILMNIDDFELFAAALPRV